MPLAFQRPALSFQLSFQYLLLPNFHAYWLLSIICGEVTSLSAFAVVEPFRGEVDIDIKPATYPNTINLRSRGVTPVAVLTTHWFDAMDVDPAFLPQMAGLRYQP